jgi:hypothetical protein
VAVPLSTRLTAPTVALAIAILLAAIAAVTGINLANDRIVGVYHDDGIYLATAQSIAEQQSYRLINLPGSPYATKYPPLYPLLLAAVWAIAPWFPENIIVLKAVNAGLVGLIAFGTYYWTGVLGLDRVTRLMIAALVAFAPGLMFFSDVLLSEPLFCALIVAVAISEQRRSRDSAGRDVLAGVLAGLATLARSLGIAVVIGLVWHIWARRGWKAAARAGLPAAAMAGAWVVWRSIVSRPRGSLVAYYIDYEQSAWAMLFSTPALGMRVLALNTRYYAEVGPLVFGWPHPALTALAIALMLAAVTVRHHRAQFALLTRIGVVYLLILVGHPLPIERYLTPLVPFVYAALGAGAAQAARLQRLGPIAIVLLAPYVVANLLWVDHFGRMGKADLHGSLGRPLAFGWQGYDDTISWLRAHTPRDAILASGTDPLYFLYTGRPGVRPWPHAPLLYSPGYAVPYRVPDASRIMSELDSLGVGYVVTGPMFATGEGRYAQDILRELLAQSPPRWREVFRTSDASHRVYERVNPH